MEPSTSSIAADRTGMKVNGAGGELEEKTSVSPFDPITSVHDSFATPNMDAVSLSEAQFPGLSIRGKSTAPARDSCCPAGFFLVIRVSASSPFLIGLCFAINLTLCCCRRMTIPVSDSPVYSNVLVLWCT